MLSPSKESWVLGLKAVLLDFCRQKKLLVESENVVKASVGSTEENSCWNKRYSSKRRKRWSTRSSLKEIVNFVFNKSTQETRILFSRLILHKKETTRRRINPKNWLQNELWHKIPKKGILTLTKVKLIVGSWQHCFEQVRGCNSLYPYLVVTWMYVIFVTLNSMFWTSIGKNMQSRILLSLFLLK